ncbi:MAG: protein translocase subunit SecF [bacterium]
MSDVKVINFMALRSATIVLSLLLMAGSIYSLATKGMVFGLDFTGGSQIEIGYERAVDPEEVRQKLAASGIPNAVVVNFGNEKDILIKLQGKPESDLGEQVVAALSGADEIQLRRIDYVGPQVGDELRDEGGLGMLAALLVVMLYVAIRFQYKFSIGAVAALIHDVIITLGFFSVTGLEFDLTVLAAVLAVIGYSLNDTIIVYDRIRENIRLLRRVDMREIINESMTQTLARTLVTSFTTILVLLALYFVGGDLIHNFAIALLAGIFIGTYSSVYVASSFLLTLNLSRDDLIRPVSSEEEFDGLP